MSRAFLRPRAAAPADNPAVGLDLFGPVPVAVALTGAPGASAASAADDPNAAFAAGDLRVADAWAPVPAGIGAGAPAALAGALLEPTGVLARRLAGLDAWISRLAGEGGRARGAVVAAVPDIPAATAVPSGGGGQYATPAAALAAPDVAVPLGTLGGVPGTGGEALTFAVPLPKRAEGRWNVLGVGVRAAAVLETADVVQTAAPGVRPRLDARVLAALRAFLLLGAPGATETVAFSHVDLTEAVHALVHRGSVVYVHRQQGGLLLLAAAEARASAERGEGLQLAEALEELLGGGPMGPAALAAYKLLMAAPVQQLRNRLGMGQASSVIGPRGAGVADFNRHVISGPLADVPDPETLRVQVVGTATAVEAFRPIAALPGVPADAARRAGQYTVALGAALTPPVGGAWAHLPVDLSALLPPERYAVARRPLGAAVRAAGAGLVPYGPGATAPAAGAVAARPGRGALAALAGGPITLPWLGNKARTGRPSGPALTVPVDVARRAKLGYLVPAAALMLAGKARWDVMRLEREIPALQADSVRLATTLSDFTGLQADRDRQAAKRRALGQVAIARERDLTALSAVARAVSKAPPTVSLLGLARTGPTSMVLHGRAGAPGDVARLVAALDDERAVVAHVTVRGVARADSAAVLAALPGARGLVENVPSSLNAGPAGIRPGVVAPDGLQFVLALDLVPPVPPRDVVADLLGAAPAPALDAGAAAAPGARPTPAVSAAPAPRPAPGRLVTLAARPSGGGGR